MGSATLVYFISHDEAGDWFFTNTVKGTGHGNPTMHHELMLCYGYSCGCKTNQIFTASTVSVPRIFLVLLDK